MPDRNILRDLAKAGSGFFEEWRRMQKGDEEKVARKAEVGSREKTSQQRWLMSFLAAERRHQERLNLDRGRVKSREKSERMSREQKLSDQLFARDLKKTQPEKPKSFDDRFDLYLQGEYEPSSREQQIFENKLQELQSPDVGKAESSRADKMPNIAEEATDKMRQIASTRANIARTNEATIGTPDIVDPFLGIDTPVQAYNLSLRHKVRGDPRFGDTQEQRNQAADSI